MDRRGICVAGNMIVDIAQTVSAWPKLGELTSLVSARERSTGGLACNVGKSLAMLDDQLPIQVFGCIGDDPEGRYIRSQFEMHPSIDTSAIHVAADTSYTLVMNDAATLERTFLHYRGANAGFDGQGLQLDTSNARMLHIGYVLLLDALDEPDAEYGTRMARVLAQAQAAGLRTSIDVVTEAGERFQQLVPPALRHTDYCIINEMEAQQVTGVMLRDDGDRVLEANMPRALAAIKAAGVTTWAAIHCPEGSYGLDEHDRYTALPSLKLPKGYIQGTTGAGDAFCAGVLYGAHEGWTLADALRLGTGAAAGSLSRPDATSGILSAQATMDMYRAMGGQ